VESFIMDATQALDGISFSRFDPGQESLQDAETHDTNQ
jgi:hypothetical protein